MIKSFFALYLLLLSIAIQAQQRSNNEKTYIYIDPCAIPQLNHLKTPLKTNPSSNKNANINADLKNPDGYPPPRLSIKIKLLEGAIRNAKDLKFKLNLANNTKQAQTFLFDRIDGPFPFLFGTTCNITNADGQSVVKYQNRGMMDQKFYHEHQERYYYTLQASEWLIKEFNVTNLCLLDSSICIKGKLPAGKYSMQINFQNNASNIVSFIVQ